MNPTAAAQALRQYNQIGTRSGVDSASPHQVIALLMEGGLTRLAAAAGHLKRGETAQKGECIGLSISIISGLQASLDHEAGGELAENLDRLYDYMIRTLVNANAENDVNAIEHVHGLLSEIKAGWDGIEQT